MSLIALSLPTTTKKIWTDTKLSTLVQPLR